MPTLYRALISIPVEAQTDKEAWKIATDFANELTDRGCTIGHVEAIRYPTGEWKDLLGTPINMDLDELERR